MQTPSPETRFLAAIGRAALAEFGAGHPLALATKAAAEGGSPADAARVQEILAGLEDGVRERLLAFAHREMREDIAAIWGLLPGAAQPGGMH
ncbi:hypothetical protein [Pseudogemmobacter bohemicus]|uniref:hypothetical protein n=1 Tax=Pseudogemmobacter bohemicus TaxID=2250708 RepID=UPI001300839E|nr:hypothetical protein [Pseudogemmobacter bohemicus]